MVCSLGNANMAAFARLQAIGSASQTITEEICHQKLAAKCSRKDFREVDEENLLDEEDMHIYGLRPMTDPLDLVCCNTCKKPVKACQYSLHAERCKSIYSITNPETNVNAPKKKPQRKPRKKLIDHAKQTPSHRELKKDETIDSGKINASASSAKGQIQMTRHAEGNPKSNGPHVMNDKRVGSYDMECSGNATLHPSKPFKRMAAGSPTNLVNESMCVTEPNVFPRTEGLGMTIAKNLSYVPKPMATKIYYTRRNHDLRRAICQIFFEEPNNGCGQNASQDELERVNALPMQTQPSEIPHSDHVMSQEGGYDFLHQPENPDQVLAPSSKLGGFVSSMSLVSQMSVNNNLEPQYM